MDQAAIQSSALKLKDLLDRYAKSDASARTLRGTLRRYIDAALDGKITTPAEWGDIPGGHLFLEGTLGKYPDLEEAFATFRIEITGKRAFVDQLSK